jgi:predicted ribosome quality control (RQC) complex YloA/Tae2 family protein
MKTKQYEGITMVLGQNARENFAILDEAEPDHYFFHLSAFPSGYVLVQSSEMTPALVNIAAEFCKSGSKYKRLRDIKIDYCKFSNLIKGEKMGLVIFRSKRQVSTVKL